MADRSSIEWTEATWNPTTGCDRVSSGCDNCYALTLARRLKAMGSAKYQNDGNPTTSGPGFALTTHTDAVLTPLTWRAPRFVFVNSMSDLFHPDVPDGFIADVWRTMEMSARHTYQILTKRPQRMRQILPRVHKQLIDSGNGKQWPLSNVWLGTSIENDTYAWRANHLRAAPAAVRFLSLEPLLGPLPSLDLSGISWVIVGGESGPGARPMNAAWVRDLRDRCLDAGVRFFLKQWGGRTPKAGGRDLDGRTWDDRPEPLKGSGQADTHLPGKLALLGVSA